MTPASPHSRFTVGITIMIVFCMASVFRKFFDIASEVERAEEHASREAAKSLEQNRFIREVLNTGSEVAADTPEEFAAFVRSESAKWAKVIRDANIKPD